MIEKFDKAIFYFFQSLPSPAMDWVLGWPTHLGQLAVLLTGVILGIFIFDRKGIFKIPAVAAGIVSANLLTERLKILFGRPRPHEFLENIRVIFEKPGNPSFPSGHTAVVFAAAFMLTHFYGKKMRWTYLAAVWVALTRIYVGVHYPTDLVGGALVGTVCGWFGCALSGLLRKTPPSA